MASPENRHCANSIGARSSPITVHDVAKKSASPLTVGKCQIFHKRQARCV